MKKELYELSYSMKKDLQKKIFRVVFFILAIIVAINLILAFLIFPVKQKSVSMAPDFNKDSCVFVTPLKKSLSRGSVVLLKKRDFQKSSFSENILDSFFSFFSLRQISFSNRKNLMGKSECLRRVIALPGDSIYMRDYVIYIRPQGQKHFLTEFELIKEPYNININANSSGWDSSIGVYGSFDEITLSENEYFVLGDNRNSSMDSRLWGPVSKSEIKAAAILQIFPLNKFRILK